jgi:predicted transposase YbfD/YdcC
VRFALSAILALAVAAILSNHLSVLAIAEWGASQHPELLRTLGFPNGVTPHQSTIQRLFGKLNPDRLSQALTDYFARCAAGSVPRARGDEGVAIDGKAQRGRLRFDSSGYPVHALSAFLHEQGIVLAQEPINSNGPSEKAEAELTVAPDLLKRIDWQGRVMTGDALLCQRNLCQEVTEAGGDYLLLVKENQPTLHEDIRLLFNPPDDALALDDCREARTVDHGHGRHYDTRRLSASTDLTGYSDWPALAQVFRLERTWQEHGATKQEVHYGITSLPENIADAQRLLELKRGHWQIENGLHWVKDVTLGEDRSLVHLGNGPSVMAILRDLAISLLHRAGHRAIASRLRYYSRHPEQAVALLTG